MAQERHTHAHAAFLRQLAARCYIEIKSIRKERAYSLLLNNFPYMLITCAF